MINRLEGSSVRVGMQDGMSTRLTLSVVRRRLNKFSTHPQRATSVVRGSGRVRFVRKILKAILKEQLVSDEVLSTVMAEAVNILNSRPLTQNSKSSLDEQPLTPNHLLHLRPCPGLPPGIFDKDDLNCRRAWRQAQCWLICSGAIGRVSTCQL